jgi:hypothetical protein
VAVESIIAALHNTLDYVREQDKRETRVIPHRLSAATQSAPSAVEGRPVLNIAQSA